MDDSESVCPLCCEELDISDQQFFPCKCGYQVCMWCWHRIRETESGLCPACRTPYGDDPHEFSAVDVAEVLKANKEKAAAEKRERDRLRSDSSLGVDGELGASGPMDLPKDRSQLANMRVIRRNLVYAVGLPPSIANEDTLRKPEYFGQYGKISKIVLNRSNVTSGDPRRASASAYVTFVHKEDTLACILALDGFFIDNRNIRASYGTSKYCSAFIKNVRCNNPECTYLHCMGDAEDTFTKQEIQAGYVTSGRDVLARQQQIVAQALSAASGGAGAGARRKVGGGGPSGTGKAAANPVFPPPCYDEPPKPSSSSLVPPPAPVVNRSASIGPSSATLPSVPHAATGKIARSASVGAPSNAAIGAQTRKGVNNPVVGPTAVGPAGATAASVVAGVHSFNNPSVPNAESAHTTLTPLTPLKRQSQTKGKSLTTVQDGTESIQLPPNMPVPKGLSPAEKAMFLEQRREAMAALAKQQREMASKLSAMRNGTPQKGNAKVGAHRAAPTSPTSSVSSASGVNAGKLASSSSNDLSVGSIGGAVLSSGGSAVGGPGLLGASASFGSSGSHGMRFDGSSGALGGEPIGGNDGFATSSSLGGEIFTGQLPSRSDSAIGSQSDKWNASGTGMFRSENAIRGGDIWGSDAGAVGPAPIGSPSGRQGGRSPGVIGGRNKSLGSIGSQRMGSDDNSFATGGASFNSGSSALASMLGINLPSGSGSLRESSSLWSSSPAPVASPSGPAGGVVGSSSQMNGAPGGGSSFGRSMMGPPNGGYRGSNVGNSNNSDMALLQSLLPGVHITSGNAKQPAAPATSGGFGSTGGNDWNSMSGPPAGQPLVGGFNVGPQGGADTWGGSAAVSNGRSMSSQGGRQQTQGQGSIW